MPVVATQDILKTAYNNRYGIPAVNVFDSISMRGILGSAERASSPIIIQISVKTLKYWGMKPIQDIFTSLADTVTIPAALHLDHCPDPELAKECILNGWNSVLFDGSSYSLGENISITREISTLAHKHGAAVEGELIPVAGVEDGIGNEKEGQLLPLEKVTDFISTTGIDFYAPAVGTAHGMYKEAPFIRYDRVEKLSRLSSIPLVLHGGSGLDDEVFTRLISLGTAKINLSTALKQCYADSFGEYLREHGTEYNPLKLFSHVEERIDNFISHYIGLFGKK